MLSLLLQPSRLKDYKSDVTNVAAVSDFNYYPRVMDPVRTGRGYSYANSKALPFLPNADFLGSDMPTLFTRQYQQRYGEIKHDLEIATSRAPSMDEYLISWRNNFVGDYNCQYPDMVEKMKDSVSKLCTQSDANSSRWSQ